MPMDLSGLLSVLLSLVAFKVGYTYHKKIPRSILLILVILGLPSVFYVLHYLPFFPEWHALYSLRATRILCYLPLLFAGVAAGIISSYLPRQVLLLPLLGFTAVGIIPYIKPLLAPLDRTQLQDLWDGPVCLQSTSSSCGPASTASLLRHLGLPSSEEVITEQCYTYARGTEAWYLMRYLQSLGLSTSLDLEHELNPDSAFPAIIGVRLGSMGHFISILDYKDGQYQVAEPVCGLLSLTPEQFDLRYQTTGFCLSAHL